MAGSVIYEEAPQSTRGVERWMVWVSKGLFISLACRGEVREPEHAEGFVNVVLWDVAASTSLLGRTVRPRRGLGVNTH